MKHYPTEEESWNAAVDFARVIRYHGIQEALLILKPMLDLKKQEFINEILIILETRN